MLKNEFSEEKTKTPIYLKILDRLAPAYRKMGIEYDQLRIIVGTKMKMDGRQENPMADAWNTASKKKKDRNSFFSSLWVYAFISLIMLFIFIVDNYIFQFTFYFSYLFLMMMAVLIAHFSNVLLDPKDQELIGTKPVSSKTLGAAKATHVGIYLIAFSLAIGGVLIIATFIFNGIAEGFLALLLTILAALWCLLLTILIYAYILRHFDGEKLKNIISYSQIALSFFMIVGYQFMGNIFQIIDPETLTMEMNLQWWHILVFPLWFVAPFGIVQEGWSWTFGSYIGLLFIGTVGLVLLYRMNSDKIDRNLQKLNSDGEKGTKRGLFQRLYAEWFCFDDREKPYFHFTWQITKNEREFKTRLYPSIASALIFPVIILWTEFMTTGLESLGNLTIFAYSPYFVVSMVPMTSTTIRYSNTYKGRWLFTMSPEDDKKVMLRGVFKAILTKLLLPIYGAVSVLAILFTGIGTLPVVVNGFLLLTIVFYIDMSVTMDVLPFTQKYDASEANRGCASTLIFFFGVAVIAGILFALQEFVPYSEYVILLVLAGMSAWVFTRGFQSKNLSAVSS